MSKKRTEVTDEGGLRFTVVDESGEERSATLDPLKDDDLRLTARDEGGFQVEFPDGEGDQLILAFVPDLDVPELNVMAGYDRDNLLQLAALQPE